MGTPTTEEWGDGYKLSKTIGFNFPSFMQTPLKQLIPGASEEACDLMHKMLAWDP